MIGSKIAQFAPSPTEFKSAPLRPDPVAALLGYDPEKFEAADIPAPG